jgi:hypothetical protein
MDGSPIGWSFRDITGISVIEFSIAVATGFSCGCPIVLLTVFLSGFSSGWPVGLPKGSRGGSAHEAASESFSRGVWDAFWGSDGAPEETVERAVDGAPEYTVGAADGVADDPLGAGSNPWSGSALKCSADSILDSIRDAMSPRTFVLIFVSWGRPDVLVLEAVVGGRPWIHPCCARAFQALGDVHSSRCFPVFLAKLRRQTPRERRSPIINISSKASRGAMGSKRLRPCFSWAVLSQFWGVL